MARKKPTITPFGFGAALCEIARSPGTDEMDEDALERLEVHDEREASQFRSEFLLLRLFAVEHAVGKLLNDQRHVKTALDVHYVNLLQSISDSDDREGFHSLLKSRLATYSDALGNTRGRDPHLELGKAFCKFVGSSRSAVTSFIAIAMFSATVAGVQGFLDRMEVKEE